MTTPIPTPLQYAQHLYAGKRRRLVGAIATLRNLLACSSLLSAYRTRFELELADLETLLSRDAEERYLTARAIHGTKRTRGPSHEPSLFHRARHVVAAHCDQEVAPVPAGRSALPQGDGAPRCPVCRGWGTIDINAEITDCCPKCIGTGRLAEEPVAIPTGKKEA